MWTTVTLSTHQVWEDCLWRVTAIWTDDDVSAPVVLQREGRAALGADDGPEDLLAAALSAFGREILDPRSQTGRR